jgi:hypothetical protein
VLGVKYEDCLQIRKTVNWGSSSDIDIIWLAKNIGVVKWKKSTGRVELQEKFISGGDELPQFGEYGKIYLNSKGIQLFESEMLESYKINSDFSTAQYDKSGKLIREDFYGSAGEMGIKFITYEYNADNLLVKELYHYTKSIKVEADVKSVWLNEYIYDNNGKLIETRYKFDIEDEEWDDTREYDHLDYKDVSELRFSKRHPLIL